MTSSNNTMFDLDHPSAAKNPLRERLSSMRMEERPDYLTESINYHRSVLDFVDKKIGNQEHDVEVGKNNVELNTKIKHMLDEAKVFEKHPPYLNPIEIRLHDVSYELPTGPNRIQRMLNRDGPKEQQKKVILNKINLVLKPGNTYLLLGPPGSGKTSLL